MAFAKQAQNWAVGEPGEIVYAGPGLIAGEKADIAAPSNLRVLLPEVNREHVGIRRLAAKRDQQESNEWQAAVTLKNFGERPRAVRLETRYAGTRFAPRLIQLAPHQETAAEYRFTTGTAGELVSIVTPADALPADQEVHLHLPQSGPLHVAVYTARAEELRPLLEANRRLVAHFYEPARIRRPNQREVVVLDGFIPPTSSSLAGLVDRSTARRLARGREGHRLRFRDSDLAQRNGVRRGVALPRKRTLRRPRSLTRMKATFRWRARRVDRLRWRATATGNIRALA